MLKKLLKYEFRATLQMMLPLYGVMLGLSVFANLAGHILDAGSNWLLTVLCMLMLLLFGVGELALMAATALFMAVRFYRSFLTDEGYLTFTLPVSVHQLLWAKLIPAVLWSVASFGVMWLSAEIVSFRASTAAELSEGLNALLHSFSDLGSALDANGALYRIELLVLVAAALVCGTLVFYAALATGHRFVRHKMLLSVVFFFVILFVGQAAGLVGLFSLGSSSALAGGLGTWSTAGLLHGALLGGIGVCVLTGALLYWLTVSGLAHKNLE